MEVNFLNQKPCIPTWPGVFQFDIFCVDLSKSMFISSFDPFQFFSHIFTYSAFLGCFCFLFFLFFFFGCHIFFQNCSVSLASGCWYVFVSSPPSCWQTFYIVVLEYPVLSVLFYPLSISLILLLLPVLSGLFPQVVLLFFLT